MTQQPQKCCCFEPDLLRVLLSWPPSPPSPSVWTLYCPLVDVLLNNQVNVSSLYILSTVRWYQSRQSNWSRRQFSPVFTSFYQFLPVFTSHWVILPPFVLYLRPYEIETLSAVNMLLFLWWNRIHIELFLNIQSMEPQGSYIRAGEPIACWGEGGLGGGVHTEKSPPESGYKTPVWIFTTFI